MPFPFPEYIQLYPTTRCNQKCSFCFNKKNGSNINLSYGNALQLLSILSDFGIKAIDIMGGEPFLLQWMPDFIETALNKTFMVNISTNGSITNMMQRFKGIDHQKFNIGVSLEGSNENNHNRLTNSSNFNKAVECIKGLVCLNLNPIVKTVVVKSSTKDIQKIIDLLIDIGVRRYYLIHMDLLSKDLSAMKESLSYVEFLEFYKSIKTANPVIDIHHVNASCFHNKSLPSDIRCAGGVLKLSIMPDGSVLPCNLFQPFKEFILGNIFKDDFNDIWMNPKLDLFRYHKANRCDIESCPNKSACTGGCPAHGFYHYGNPDLPDIRCVL